MPRIVKFLKIPQNRNFRKPRSATSPPLAASVTRPMQIAEVAALNRILFHAALYLLLPLCAWAQQYTISTFAGTGAPGETGDAGSAVNATLSAPVGVLIDPKGNLYIVDNGNERIRLVSAGVINTIAGDGATGYFGDGEPATDGQINSPAAVALDSSGNLYIADSGNNVIRMVAPNGNISTVAGNVCTSSTTTDCGAGFSGDGGAATAAQLNNPLGVAVDSSGNLYISDSGNNVIRKVSGGNIATVGSTLRLLHPAGIALDVYQNLYIADTSNSRIVKYTPSGAGTVVAGTGVAGYSGDGGPAIQATLEFPADVKVDGVGNLYIADRTNCVIREVTVDGTINTIAGNGQTGYSGEGAATAVELNFPGGVAIDPYGDVYIADTGNNRVRLLQPPPPAISTGGVVNAASFAVGVPISPGEIASVFGTYFGVSIGNAASVPLPTVLAGVSITVGGRKAPLFYVNPSQINFQVPWETPLGSANVVVSLNGVPSNTAAVPVIAASPGLFTMGTAAVVLNSDNTLNQSSSPAAPGSAISAYLTGSGPVNHTIADGVASPSAPLVEATSKVTATIGTQSAQVLFAGLAPGFVGLLQVNLTVPAGLASGSYPLTVSIGGQASNSASISVK